jgi:hypothetical protein
MHIFLPVNPAFLAHSMPAFPPGWEKSRMGLLHDVSERGEGIAKQLARAGTKLWDGVGCSL